MTTQNLAPWDQAAQSTALIQGWGVYDIWDGSRLYSAIQRPLNGETFKSDDIAVRFVTERATAGDLLAQRALRHVFKSQTPEPPKANRATRRKKK